MKVSLIITLLNEEKTIGKLLNSIVEQTKKPDEIIICDGGSKDKTIKITQNSKLKTENHNLKLKILIRHGVNRARGRNEAIEQATGDIICVTDAGCILDENWIANIIKPFNNSSIDIVAGFYQPVTKNVFQKCLACYTSIMTDKVDPANFLPSSRSIAFKKQVWQEIGGYPENLDYCEDLVFAKKLKDRGFKFTFAKDAIVYWPQKENLRQAFAQFFHYAQGDSQARYRPHLNKILLIYLRYLLFFIIFILGFVYDISIYHIFTVGLILAYISWAVIKNYRYVEKTDAVIYLPIIQVTADLAVMFGFLRGLIK